MRMFSQIIQCAGAEVSSGELYGKLFNDSLRGDADCGGVLLYNYISGEPVTGLTDGRPLLVRRQDSKLSLSNFIFRSTSPFFLAFPTPFCSKLAWSLSNNLCSEILS